MNDFKWAYGNNANLKEPIATLKEKGWQYADIPTASNFNWIFNQIEKDLRAISGDIATFKESINAELTALKQDVASIKKTAQSALEKTVKHEQKIEWHIGVSGQICRGLVNMERAIKRHHPDFTTQPWPLKDDGPQTTENETEV
jgi:hypothetical protein